MNCVRCGSPTNYNEPSLCSVCFESALANAAEFKRLFVDSSVARAAKVITEERDGAEAE